MTCSIFSEKLYDRLSVEAFPFRPVELEVWMHVFCHRRLKNIPLSIHSLVDDKPKGTVDRHKMTQEASPLADLPAAYVALTSDGRLKKKVLRAGTGKCPTQASQVEGITSFHSFFVPELRGNDSALCRYAVPERTAIRFLSIKRRQILFQAWCRTGDQRMGRRCEIDAGW